MIDGWVIDPHYVDVRDYSEVWCAFTGGPDDDPSIIVKRDGTVEIGTYSPVFDVPGRIILAAAAEVARVLWEASND